MARYLVRLIDSLDEYFITGIFPVLDATQAAIGGVAFDPEYGAALRDTEVGQKVAIMLANVANSVTVASGMLHAGRTGEAGTAATGKPVRGAPPLAVRQ